MLGGRLRGIWDELGDWNTAYFQKQAYSIRNPMRVIKCACNVVNPNPCLACSVENILPYIVHVEVVLMQLFVVDNFFVGDYNSVFDTLMIFLWHQS